MVAAAARGLFTTRGGMGCAAARRTRCDSRAIPGLACATGAGAGTHPGSRDATGDDAGRAAARLARAVRRARSQRTSWLVARAIDWRRLRHVAAAAGAGAGAGTRGADAGAADDDAAAAQGSGRARSTNPAGPARGIASRPADCRCRWTRRLAVAADAALSPLSAGW